MPCTSVKTIDRNSKKTNLTAAFLKQEENKNLYKLTASCSSFKVFTKYVDSKFHENRSKSVTIIVIHLDR